MLIWSYDKRSEIYDSAAGIFFLLSFAVRPYSVWYSVVIVLTMLMVILSAGRFFRLRRLRKRQPPTDDVWSGFTDKSDRWIKLSSAYWILWLAGISTPLWLGRPYYTVVIATVAAVLAVLTAAVALLPDRHV